MPTDRPLNSVPGQNHSYVTSLMLHTTGILFDTVSRPERADYCNPMSSVLPQDRRAFGRFSSSLGISGRKRVGSSP